MLQGKLGQGPALQEVTERAIDAILLRARQLLRHAARPSSSVTTSWPDAGELDVQATLEQAPRPRRDARRSPFDPQDLVLSRREPRDAAVCVILDMSLSMTGEKVALIAVAAAILRMKLQKIGVVAFDSTAHPLAWAGRSLPVRELVRRVLSVPAQGHTNIAAGLEAALEQLDRCPRSEQVGLLLSDGVANLGQDPALVAGRFGALHVIQLGRALPQGTRACREMATAGRGRRFHAPAYVTLPEVVKRTLRELFRV